MNEKIQNQYEKLIKQLFNECCENEMKYGTFDIDENLQIDCQEKLVKWSTPCQSIAREMLKYFGKK